MAVGATATLDAAYLNATYGANATGAKVSVDNLVVINESLAPYTPQQMIDPVEQGGLGLAMTLQDAETIKAGLAEVLATIKPALDATVAFKKAYGLGVG